MKTQRLEKNELEKAAQLIKEGETVAFPTDTVYGLGADALNEEAVQKIFKAKGRPADRPISVLIGQASDIEKYTKDIAEEVWLLTEKFWPGPLTIILKSNGMFASTVTAGRDSIGLRMPDNQVALDFIKTCGTPLATPSANTSGRPSPTKANHVLTDLDGKISAVINGGETSTGIESTVLDFSNSDEPIILRPGNISRKQIEETIQRPVKVLEQSNNEKHYKPSIPLYMVQSNWVDSMNKMREQGEKIAILASEEIVQQYKEKAETCYSLGKAEDIAAANRRLFDGLRTLEQTEATVILAETFENGEESHAYMNRLQNAAEKNSI